MTSPPVRLTVPLQTNPLQFERLERLQKEFSSACNEVAQVAQEQQCRNRVALHHLVYRGVRQRHPALGAQMACNAVYAVVRALREKVGRPALALAGQKSPVKLTFAPDAPVFFDRHTMGFALSMMSVFTQDGRLRVASPSLGADEVKVLGSFRILEARLCREAAGFFFVFDLVPQAANAAVSLDQASVLAKAGVSAGAETAPSSLVMDDSL